MNNYDKERLLIFFGDESSPDKQRPDQMQQADAAKEIPPELVRELEKYKKQLRDEASHAKASIQSLETMIEGAPDSVPMRDYNKERVFRQMTGIRIIEESSSPSKNSEWKRQKTLWEGYLSKVTELMKYYERPVSEIAREQVKSKAKTALRIRILEMNIARYDGTDSKKKKAAWEKELKGLRQQQQPYAEQRTALRNEWKIPQKVLWVFEPDETQTLERDLDFGVKILAVPPVDITEE